MTINGITPTVFGYLATATSDIQAQINGKQALGSYLTGNQTVTLSGDATGSGATAITTIVAKANGTTVPARSAADQTLVTTASATGAWVSIPACLDATGNHLNYNTTTHSFTCGTTSSASGGSSLTSTSSSLTFGAILDVACSDQSMTVTGITASTPPDSRLAVRVAIRRDRHGNP